MKKIIFKNENSKTIITFLIGLVISFIVSITWGCVFFVLFHNINVSLFSMILTFISIFLLFNFTIRKNSLIFKNLNSIYKENNERK